MPANENGSEVACDRPYTLWLGDGRSPFFTTNPLGSPNQNRFERRSALMVRTASDHTRTTG